MHISNQTVPQVLCSITDVSSFYWLQIHGLIAHLTISSPWPLKLILQSHGRSSFRSSLGPLLPAWSSLLQSWSLLLSASGQNITHHANIQYMTSKVCSRWKHWEKYTHRFQMSALIVCPLRQHRTLSVDCFATCEATEFQISIQNLWIINSFCPKHCFAHWKQWDTAAVGFDRHSDLTVYLAYQKDTCRSSSAGIHWVERCNFIHEHAIYLSSCKCSVYSY